MKTQKLGRDDSFKRKIGHREKREDERIRELLAEIKKKKMPLDLPR